MPDNIKYKNSFYQLKKDLESKIVLLDGAMGTMVLNSDSFKEKKYDRCIDYLVLTEPEMIKSIHKMYLKAGSDIIETNTFGALDITLKDYGLENSAFEINKSAALLVKKAIEEYRKENPDEKRNLYVAGASGPSNKSLSSGNITFEELAHAYYVSVSGLLAGNVDIILLETILDTESLKAAYLGIQKAMKEYYYVPLMLSFTLKNTGTTFAGQTIHEIYNTACSMNPLSIGFNCAVGGEFFGKFIKTLNNISNVYTSFYPNAGLPDKNGKYEKTPDVLASETELFFQNNCLNIVGGCCGTTPEHIRQIKEKSIKYLPRSIELPVL